MNQKIIQAINDYRERLIQTSSESAKKETFKTLLIRLYDNESSLRKIIDEFDAGSEKVVYNIPLAHRNKIGFADTQYRNVIIEFERDLKVTLEHAKEQLSEYLVGNWLSGNNFDYVLIATDCLTWKVYSPKFDNLLKTDILTPEDIELVEKHSFILDAKNALDFYYFIDHYIFRAQPQIPTYETIKNDFGDLSQTFLNCLRILIGYWSKVENDPEIKIAYEQWKLFLNIAYGRFNDDVRVFLVHTYLSIFSKFLAYSVITGQRYINDSDLRDIVNGEIFKKLNVNNFIEKDFYYWVGKEPHFPKLRPLFRHLVVQISDYDFSTTNEDILKGVYQELIDIDTKHALGEYYTPDWLAAMITNHLDIDENTSVLDPSCGSGSFLRAVISKMIGSSPEPDINEITNNVVGIDIHPLSVQIAKTTVLLSFGKRLSELKRPLNLHVYLANTLKIVRESKDLLDTIFTVEINNTKIYLDRAIIQEQSLFDDIINFCQKLAELDSPALRINQNEFSEIFRGQFPKINNSNIIKSAHNIFMQLRDAVFQKKDSIWAFILINSYKPQFLQGKFDFVVGNPPWLPYRDMNNEPYQDEIIKLAEEYSLLPRNANITHLEIAAVFLSHCSSIFLKPGGKIAFVLPRGFLTADHHENTRSGAALGFTISEIWDLKNVTPLFRITSCVIIADKSQDQPDQTKLNIRPINGKILAGRLSTPHLNLKTASSVLSMAEASWSLSVLGKRTAFSISENVLFRTKSVYLEKFKQGATIVPRNFYFVQLEQQVSGSLNDRIIYVATNQEIMKDAKKPWDTINLREQIDTQYLFTTALSKNVFPFIAAEPFIVHLPILFESNRPRMQHWTELLRNNFLASAKWFKLVEENWDKYKTEKNSSTTYLDWLNYQNKLTSQVASSKYVVLYTASAKDASACIIYRTNYDLPFIIESATYYYNTDSLEEAYYLTTFLNSGFANKLIKSFQATGLFGVRHVHKKILEIPLPEFDISDKKHIALYELGIICETKVKIGYSPETLVINSGHELGRIRLQIRDLLKNELEEIDKILEVIIK